MAPDTAQTGCGAWFWWVAGITPASLMAAVVWCLAGRGAAGADG